MGEERKEKEEERKGETKEAELKKEEGEKEGEGGGEGEKKEGVGEKKEEEEKKAEGENAGEIVLKVEMHCEGCARKVQRSLRGFPGVDEVQTDSKSHKVIVKGKDADAEKVCERILKKNGKKVEIISPLPKPPLAEEEKKEEPKQEEEKKEEPVVVTVVLSVRMHCESCAQVVQRRIQKMKGVASVETDLNDDKVIVKGVVDPSKVVEYIYKQTRKVATIVPPPPPPLPPPEEEKKEEKKNENCEVEKKEGDEEKAAEEDLKSEVKKSEYWPSRYYVEYAYPPQIFSDENPNACSVM